MVDKFGELIIPQAGFVKTNVFIGLSGLSFKSPFDFHGVTIRDIDRLTDMALLVNPVFGQTAKVVFSMLQSRMGASEAEASDNINYFRKSFYYYKKNSAF